MKNFILTTMFLFTLATGLISGIAYERYLNREACLSVAFDNSGAENLTDEEITQILKILNKDPEVEDSVQENNNSDNNTENLSAIDQNRAFVGSKNSNKFYPVNCRYVKLIKEENKIYFNSIKDGEAIGKIYMDCK